MNEISIEPNSTIDSVTQEHLRMLSDNQKALNRIIYDMRQNNASMEKLDTKSDEYGKIDKAQSILRNSLKDELQLFREFHGGTKAISMLLKGIENTVGSTPVVIQQSFLGFSG